MGMIKKYFTELYKYKEQYGENIMLLWQCGGFYEYYALKGDGKIKESNIMEFGAICDYAVKEKKTASSTGTKFQKYKDIDGKSYTVLMSGMPIFGAIESKISKLNEKGYTVALWKQEKNKKDERKEFGIFSPGTNFMENNDLTNIIMCVFLETIPKTLLSKNPRLICGLSIIDIITGETKIYQYQSEYFNESINYDEIERFYSIYKPSEIIIIHNFNDEKKVTNMLEFSCINNNSKHVLNMLDTSGGHYMEILNSKKQLYQIEIMKKIYGKDIVDNDYFYLNFAEHPYATASYCFLLNFVYKHQKNLVKKIKMPVYDNSSDNMILANHSLKQLNIIGDGKKKCSSVLKLLNDCSTQMGRREFGNQLLHPCTDIDKLNKEYNVMDHVMNNQEKYFNLLGNKMESKFRVDLRSLIDIDKFYRKIILEKITPLNIYMFYKNLESIKKIWLELSNDKVLLEYFEYKKIKGSISNKCKKIIKSLKNELIINKISEVSTPLMDVNIFKPGYSTKVDTVICEYKLAEETIDGIIEIFNKNLSKHERNKKKQYIKLNITEKSNPYLVLTSRRAAILKETFKEPLLKINEKYVLDINSIKFVDATKNNKKMESDQLKKLYKLLFDGKEKVKYEVREEYTNYMKRMLCWSDEIEEISNFIKVIDVLFNKCELSINNGYCKPKIIVKEKAYYKAKNMRHLLIERIQNNILYVPNDIGLGEESDGILLYGTNSVGKSSLIKSIGICVIMAQAGMYVPCSSFTYSPYDSLYTRILGNDDIFKGLSSFAVEMCELKSILNNASKNSLILGDELCRGTEFKSALKIFVAGLITLDNINCSYIFATHFHEISGMKILKKLKKLVLKHMEVMYNKKLGCLVYDRKLRDGPGTNDYGLLVCRSLGLSKDFIKLAESVELNIHIKNENPLKNNTSKYNSKKIRGKCELCDGIAVDIHHMHPQKNATASGLIRTKEGKIFKKNHKANLMSICKSCHVKVTNGEITYEIIQTTNGYKYISL